MTFSIEEHIGILNKGNSSKWSKELNLISWFGKPAKFDIRDWNSDHEKSGKGVTLTEEELYALYEILKEYFGDTNNNNNNNNVSTQNIFFK